MLEKCLLLYFTFSQHNMDLKDLQIFSFIVVYGALKKKKLSEKNKSQAELQMGRERWLPDYVWRMQMLKWIKRELETGKCN